MRVSVGELTDEEITQVVAAFPMLDVVQRNPRAAALLLRSPYLVELLIRAAGPDGLPTELRGEEDPIGVVTSVWCAATMAGCPAWVILKPAAIPGCGGLDLTTVYHAEVQRSGMFRFGWFDGPWGCLSELTVAGYEIHHGRTTSATEHQIVPDGVGFVRDNVLAVYFHGLFENKAVLDAMLGVTSDLARQLGATFDRLAEAVAAHFDMARIERMVFG